MGLRLAMPLLVLQASFLSTTVRRAGAFTHARALSRARFDLREATKLFQQTVGLRKEEKDPGVVRGTKLRILKYPHPKLRADNLKVTTFDQSLADTAANMLKVMYAADGIGLAAPQVGINLRLMVFNEMSGEEPEIEKTHEKVLVNPVIVEMSDEVECDEEGCLSFPHLHGDVLRSSWVDVEYQDLQGEVRSVSFEGQQARIFQHEYDHLDKVLFIDRLDATDKQRLAKRLSRMVSNHGQGAAL